jgi:hypothetical protein
MKTAIIWVVTQRVVVIPYGSFRTKYRSHLQISRKQKIPEITQVEYNVLDISDFIALSPFLSYHVSTIRIHVSGRPSQQGYVYFYRYFC